MELGCRTGPARQPQIGLRASHAVGSRSGDRPDDQGGEDQTCPALAVVGRNALGRQVHVQFGLSKLAVICPLALSAKCVTS
jgi:hypothetical protein